VAWLAVAGDEVVLRLSLLERRAGFVLGDARMPVKAIVRARAVDDPWRELRGFRSPGTTWARRLAVGTWRFPGGKDYVALRGRGPGVVLDLDGLEFARVLVSAAEAESIAEEIERAVDDAVKPPRLT
jgi:hypothetical protein